MTLHIKLWVGIFSCLILVLFSIHRDAAAGERIIIGGKNFTEQYLLAELAKRLLEKNGFDVDLKTGIGSVVARQSLENGQIDFYYEYTGTAYTVYHKQSNRNVMIDPERVYQWVKKADAGKDLVWIDPVKFNNTYTLMMREKQAQKLGIASISDLGRHIKQHPDKLIVGVNAEFWERPDGFKPLMKTYEFRIPYNRVKKMDSGLVYKALKEGNVDVSMGFATDGRISAFHFINLKDDRSYFPVYSPAPVVREEIINKYPKIRTILKPIADNLNTGEMQELNRLVDIDHKDVGLAAGEWLKKQGLL